MEILMQNTISAALKLQVLIINKPQWIKIPKYQAKYQAHKPWGDLQFAVCMRFKALRFKSKKIMVFRSQDKQCPEMFRNFCE